MSESKEKQELNDSLNNSKTKKKGKKKKGFVKRTVNKLFTGKSKKQSRKTQAEKIAQEQHRRRKKVVEASETMSDDKMTLKIWRTEPTRGYVADITGEDIDPYNSVEEMLKDKFGGGAYKVVIFEERKDPREVRYQIDGKPKVTSNSNLFGNTLDGKDEVTLLREQLMKAEQEKMRIEKEAKSHNTAELITAIGTTVTPVLQSLVQSMNNNNQKPTNWSEIVQGAMPLLDRMMPKQESNNMKDMLEAFDYMSKAKESQMQDPFRMMQMFEQMHQRSMATVKEMVNEQMERQSQGGQDDVWQGALQTILGLIGAKGAGGLGASGFQGSGGAPKRDALSGQPTSTYPEQFQQQFQQSNRQRQRPQPSQPPSQPQSEPSEFDQLAVHIGLLADNSSSPSELAESIVENLDFLNEDSIATIERILSQIKPEWMADVIADLRDQIDLDFDEMFDEEDDISEPTETRESRRFGSPTAHSTPNENDLT